MEGIIYKNKNQIFVNASAIILIILKHVSERQNFQLCLKEKKQDGGRHHIEIQTHRGKERKSSPLKFEDFDPNPTVYMTSIKCLQYIQIHKIGTSPDRESTMTQGDVPLKKEREDLVSSH